MSFFDLSFLPTQRSEIPTKLENYAQVYVKYTKIIQDQGVAMHHDTQKISKAYEQVAAEHAAEQAKFATNNFMGPSSILADLNEYARRCDIKPKSFQDRVRIAFAASGLVQIMIQFVLGNLDQDGMEWVLARSTQLMNSRDLNQQNVPIFAPAICKLKPDNTTTSFVTSKDIARWQSDPDGLVGKVFITNERIMRRTFSIQDYYIKRTGPCFDVVFEDTGFDDVQVLEPQSVWTMVKDAKLINM